MILDEVHGRSNIRYNSAKAKQGVVFSMAMDTDKNWLPEIKWIRSREHLQWRYTSLITYNILNHRPVFVTSLITTAFGLKVNVKLKQIDSQSAGKQIRSNCKCYREWHWKLSTESESET